MSTVSREKGATFCPVHPNKKLVFLCKQCNILICNKCIFKEHLGHLGEEMEEIAEKKFGKLEEFITKTERTTIPQTKQKVNQYEAQVNTRKKELEAGIERAYQHEEFLVELVKKNTHKTVSELRNEIQTINQQLSQFKSESDKYLDDLKSAVNECKETKTTKNDILLIDVVNGVEKLGDVPLNYQILQTKNNFIPGLNATVDIANAFGSVRNNGSSHQNQQQDLHSKGTSAPIEHRQLLSQPQVSQCMDVKSNYPHSIEKFRNGTLFFCCWDEPNVYLVDKSGDIKEIILDVSVRDIAIHPTTDVLYSVCPSDKSIRTVNIHTGTTSIVFTTEYEHDCLAFTKDGTILVGFYDNNKVVNYTVKGEVLKSVGVGYPWHISVCDNTGNIVIASCAADAQVMNKDLQTVFVYTGQTNKQSENALNCYDAVFDTEGHILVGDRDNNEVHIVDANTGNHLSTINSDKFGDIHSLCVNHDGGLVVGTDTPDKLVFVKYM